MQVLSVLARVVCWWFQGFKVKVLARVVCWWSQGYEQLAYSSTARQTVGVVRLLLACCRLATDCCGTFQPDKHGKQHPQFDIVLQGASWRAELQP